MAVRRPTLDQLRSVAEDLGMHMGDEELKSYDALMQANYAAYDAVDAMLAPEIELTQIQVVEPQLVALTRDIRVQPTGSAGDSGLALLLAGKVKAAGGLQSLAVNGREEVVDRDGLFKARVPLKERKRSASASWRSMARVGRQPSR